MPSPEAGLCVALVQSVRRDEAAALGPNAAGSREGVTQAHVAGVWRSDRQAPTQCQVQSRPHTPAWGQRSTGHHVAAARERTAGEQGPAPGAQPPAPATDPLGRGHGVGGAGQAGAWLAHPQL